MADTPRLAQAPHAPLELVEWRVDGKPKHDGRPNGGWTARWVPYLDAAAVGNLLDEWVGPAGWRDRYEHEVFPSGKAVLWCHLSVRDPATGEWVTKSDIGLPSSFEPEKGQVSDAFKRAACLRWGAGRNVYELPNITAPCNASEYNGKTYTFPNDQTLPAILAELKRRGFEAEGSRVGGDDSSSEQPAQATTPASGGAADGEGGAAPAAGDPQPPNAGAPSSDTTALEAEKRNNIGDLFKKVPEQFQGHVVTKLRERNLIKRKTKQAATTADADKLDTIIETLEKAVEFYKQGPPEGVDPATGETTGAPDSVERLRATLVEHEGKLTSEQAVTWASWWEEQYGERELNALDADETAAAVAKIVTIF